MYRQTFITSFVLSLPLDVMKCNVKRRFIQRIIAKASNAETLRTFQYPLPLCFRKQEPKLSTMPIVYTKAMNKFQDFPGP